MRPQSRIGKLQSVKHEEAEVHLRACAIRSEARASIGGISVSKTVAGPIRAWDGRRLNKHISTRGYQFRLRDNKRRTPLRESPETAQMYRAGAVFRRNVNSSSNYPFTEIGICLTIVLTAYSSREYCGEQNLHRYR